MNKRIKILITSILGVITLGGGGMLGFSNFVSNTPTNLTVSSFATTSISQWNNDAGYVTSTSGGAETDPIFMAASTSLSYPRYFEGTIDLTTVATTTVVPAIAGKRFIPLGFMGVITDSDGLTGDSLIEITNEGQDLTGGGYGFYDVVEGQVLGYSLGDANIAIAPSTSIDVVVSLADSAETATGTAKVYIYGFYQ